MGNTVIAGGIDGRKVRAAERREETRERLLAAAVAVFTEQGFQAGTTKAITQRAGVAEGLLFHYFPTKTDLLLAVLARDPLLPEIDRLLTEMGDQPVEAALPQMARRWLAVVRENGPVASVLLQAAHADPQVQAAIYRTVQAIIDRLAAYFAQQIMAGRLRPVAPEAAAQILFQSLCSLGMSCPAARVSDPERLLDQHVELLLRGVLPPSATTAEPPDAAR